MIPLEREEQNKQMMFVAPPWVIGCLGEGSGGVGQQGEGIPMDFSLLPAGRLW